MRGKKRFFAGALIFCPLPTIRTPGTGYLKWQEGHLLPPDLLSQTHQVCGWNCFFRLSYFYYSDLQLFVIFIFEVDFSGTYLMTSAENSILEPPNLKIFWGRIPPDPPFKACAFGTRNNTPPPLLPKNLARTLL